MALGDRGYRLKSDLIRRREQPSKSIWHGYRLTLDEQRRIDSMMGKALIDPHICDRLVNQRDSALLDEFGLSAETQQWLCSIQAASLIELAQAITAYP
jgi:hypothetical protein